jgi:hypothetical protein
VYWSLAMKKTTRELLDGERLFVIRWLLTPAECEGLIQRSEGIGYQAATLAGEVVPELRNNARLIHDDPSMATWLWERSRQFLPAWIKEWRATGLNPRFRFYRYTEAESFRPHSDGVIRLEDGQESRLTFIVYLSDVPRGGQTRSFDPRGEAWLEVGSEAGKALVFDHHLFHEGVAVQEGCKYVLRTDVMYQRAS